MEGAKEAIQDIIWNDAPGDLPVADITLNHLFSASEKLILKKTDGTELKGRYLVYIRDHAILNFTAKKGDSYFGDIHDLLVADVVAWAFDLKPNEHHAPDGK